MNAIEAPLIEAPLIEAPLDKPIFQALIWALIHFRQGALIAILYLNTRVLLRPFSAHYATRDRLLVLCC